MTVTEALQLIEKNEHVPALSHAINYAHYALQLISYAGEHTREFKIQLLYILDNTTHWRQCKASTTTAAEIRKCQAVLKKASL